MNALKAFAFGGFGSLAVALLACGVIASTGWNPLTMSSVGKPRIKHKPIKYEYTESKTIGNTVVTVKLRSKTLYMGQKDPSREYSSNDAIAYFGIRTDKYDSPSHGHLKVDGKALRVTGSEDGVLKDGNSGWAKFSKPGKSLAIVRIGETEFSILVNVVRLPLVASTGTGASTSEEVVELLGFPDREWTNSKPSRPREFETTWSYDKYPATIFVFDVTMRLIRIENLGHSDVGM